MHSLFLLICTFKPIFAEGNCIKKSTSRGRRSIESFGAYQSSLVSRGSFIHSSISLLFATKDCRKKFPGKIDPRSSIGKQKCRECLDFFSRKWTYRREKEERNGELQRESGRKRHKKKEDKFKRKKTLWLRRNGREPRYLGKRMGDEGRVCVCIGNSAIAGPNLQEADKYLANSQIDIRHSACVLFPQQ